MKRALAIALFAVSLVACGVPVDVETDPAARHGTWKEWSWLQRPPVARGDTELAAVDERVRKAFEREMKARSFRQVERNRPDFVVTFYAALNGPIDPKALDYAAGMPANVRTAVNSAGVYAQGILIVDLLDAKTGRLAWRGVGRNVFDPKHAAVERQERIDAAVAALVEEFSAR